ncbi:hypothetical protein [Paenibacillus sp. BT-177]|uniref:hypothetical protein n=1 Tax=Paenibacillus sp. BT-177 TaxID=2986930 RepID=UPI0021F71BE5|nr:hypothetical protein [Paenibacillus sp. BT-177]
MNKKIKQAWIILTVVVGLFIVVCVSSFLSDNKEQDEASVPVINNHWYYEFTDDQIQAAINKGLESDRSDMFQEESSRIIKVHENNLLEMKENPPLVYFYTPTYQIIRRAYEDSQKMDMPSVSDVRRDNINENFLYFSIDVGMDREDAYQNFHAVLRQGDVTLQPVGGKLARLDSPSTKIFSPGEGQAKYTKEVIAPFMIDDKINLKEPLYLTFIYSGKNDTATYEIIPSQQR